MHDERLNRARIALEGLSVGDALGGFFEFSAGLKRLIQARELPSAPWHFTDDTNMALSIYEILRKYGEIRQDELAESFAKYFQPTRGYGMGARALMVRMRKGQQWREVSAQLFGGGSYGNGGAMRVAPLGAYFADDIKMAVKQTRLSSEITHAHEEGIAGTIAVAVGAAYAWQMRGQHPNKHTFLDAVLQHLPNSEVKKSILIAYDLDDDTSVQNAAKALGSGHRVTAQDTVPFVLWCAARHLDNYEEAIWNTASAFGDVDTTCAMVGGIVATYTGIEGIPAEWIVRREPLPRWAFEDE